MLSGVSPRDFELFMLLEILLAILMYFKPKLLIIEDKDSLDGLRSRFVVVKFASVSI